MNAVRRDAILLAAAEVILVSEFSAAVLLERIRGTLALTDPEALVELERGLALLDSIPFALLTRFSFRRFSRADRHARSRALAALRGSSLPAMRTLYLAVQRLVASSYYSDPLVQRALGYPGAKSA